MALLHHTGPAKIECGPAAGVVLWDSVFLFPDKRSLSYLLCVKQLLTSSLFVVLGLSSWMLSSAQISSFSFESNLSDNIASFTPEYTIQETTEDENLVTYEDGYLNQGALLSPEEGILFPVVLSEALLANDVFEINLKFKVNAMDAAGEKTILDIKQNVSYNSPGVTFFIERNEDAVVQLFVLFADGNAGNNGGDPAHLFTVGEFAEDEWIDLRYTCDFQAGSWSVFANSNFLTQSFDEFFDTPQFASTLNQLPIWLGWKQNQNFVPDWHTAEIVVDEFKLYDDLIPVDIDAYKDALNQLTDHLEGEAILSDEELQDAFTVVLNSHAHNYQPAMEEVDAFMAAYESVSAPMFLGGSLISVFEMPLIDQALFLIQQDIFDNFFVEETVADTEGIRFEALEAFPGDIVDEAPRLDDVIVEINATYNHDPGVEANQHEFGARRPTGYYLAPGELATMSVPQSLVDAGAFVYVGAHIVDLSSKLANINRFPRISKEYPITSQTITIGNPFGGGVYFRIPDGTDAGWVEIELDNVIKAPYFSYRTDHITSVAEWTADMENGYVPFCDFESDNFMFTLPVADESLVINPDTIMGTWDHMWEASHFWAGRPSAPARAEYIVCDSRLQFGALGAGYPMSLIINNWTHWSPLRILNDDDSFNEDYLADMHMDIYLHELGHNLSYPMPGQEAESIIHMLGVSMLAHGMGFDISEAMTYMMMRNTSEGNRSPNLDESAMDWMIAHNFRNNNEMGCDPTLPEGECHELRYQNRGHAKYADMVLLFGWEALHEMNKTFYDEWNAAGGLPEETGPVITTDELILAASNATGKNMAPLFHFWGYHPSEELMEVLDDYPMSLEICGRLLHYGEMIPPNAVAFQPWYDTNYEAVGYPQTLRYDEALANWDEEDYTTQITTQMGNILGTYGMAKCWVNVEEESGESEIKVWPNPTNGVLNIESVSGISATVQIHDGLGRLVLEANTNGQRSQVDLQSLGDGVYFVKLVSAGGIQTHQIVKAG